MTRHVNCPSPSTLSRLALLPRVSPQQALDSFAAMPRIAVSAPKCAKCGKSVYVAEQVIGPSSKPYHKPCLSCSVCERRLDSTLLVEHDGLPFCKNCHKAHLGQGKGGFGLAVPLRPPEIIRSPPKASHVSLYSSTSTRQADEAREMQRREDQLNEQLSGINLSRREGSRPLPSPTRREQVEPTYNMSTPTKTNSRPVTSIDDMVASGMEVPMLRGRNGDTSRNEVFQSLYGSSSGNGDRIQHEEFASSISSAPPRQPDASEKPAAPVPTPMPARSSSPLSKPTLPAEPPSTPSRDTIGSIRLGADGLPTPSRKDPLVLSREREGGLGGGSGGTAKTYSPRTAPQASPANRTPGKGREDGYVYSPSSALNKMGLGSTVGAAAVGTPLCARCERPVCEYSNIFLYRV